MRRAALLVAVMLLTVTGCSATVSLTPGAQATSVRCASVVVGLPTAVGAAQQLSTDAQGTGAWGSPVAVTLRCGVAQPGVSASCYPYDGVDWIPEDRTIDGTHAEVATTFGRDPAVQIVVDPHTSQSVSIDDAVEAVSDDIASATRRVDRCTAHASALPTASPTSTATP